MHRRCASTRVYSPSSKEGTRQAPSANPTEPAASITDWRVFVFSEKHLSRLWVCNGTIHIIDSEREREYTYQSGIPSVHSTCEVPMDTTRKPPTINEIILLAEAVGRTFRRCRQGTPACEVKTHMQTRRSVIVDDSAAICVSCYDHLCLEQPSLLTMPVIDGRNIPD